MREAKAELEFNFDSEEEARRLSFVLAPEIESAPSDRTSVSLNQEDNNVLLYIASREAAPFRAAVSTYLRWIKTIKEIESV
ncbi:MAG: KEOPS complex subunit Pcc1 [Candidatus Hydrothermarchaeales archaeon]